ncbi:MAG: thioredoxin family protein [Campylobacterales bacterium]|nr:thioredoxin family protein [Campylobacterales bacterium]
MGAFKTTVKTLFVLLIASCAYALDVDVASIAHDAKKQNKHVMFFHHIPGCPYCKAMLDENFKDEAILKEIEAHFIYVDVYTQTQGTITYKDFKGSYKAFSAHVGAFAYPSTLFMNGEGEVVHAAIGYRNINEHFAEISYVSTGSYKHMDLESYVQKLELEKE